MTIAGFLVIMIIMAVVIAWQDTENSKLRKDNDALIDRVNSLEKREKVNKGAILTKARLYQNKRC